MGQKSVKWGKVKKYFLAHGYEIRKVGGDTIIIAPHDGNNSARTRNTVTIGHKCSTKPGDELYDSYVKLIERAFNVSREDILK